MEGNTFPPIRVNMTAPTASVPSNVRCLKCGGTGHPTPTCAEWFPRTAPTSSPQVETLDAETLTTWWMLTGTMPDMQRLNATVDQLLGEDEYMMALDEEERAAEMCAQFLEGMSPPPENEGKHPHLYGLVPEDVWIEFFRRLPVGVFYAVCTCVRLPPYFQEFLSRHPDENVRASVAESFTVTAEVAKKLACDPCETVRLEVAKNIFSRDALEEFSVWDMSVKVRLAAAHNLSTHVETLVHMSENDPCDKVRTAAYGTATEQFN